MRQLDAGRRPGAGGSRSARHAPLWLRSAGADLRRAPPELNRRPQTERSCSARGSSAVTITRAAEWEREERASGKWNRSITAGTTPVRRSGCAGPGVTHLYDVVTELYAQGYLVHRHCAQFDRVSRLTRSGRSRAERNGRDVRNNPAPNRWVAFVYSSGAIRTTTRQQCQHTTCPGASVSSS